MLKKIIKLGKNIVTKVESMLRQIKKQVASELIEANNNLEKKKRETKKEPVRPTKAAKKQSKLINSYQNMPNKRQQHANNSSWLLQQQK